MTRPRILVAGGTGLVGGALVRRLAAAGADVSATWRRRRPEAPAVPFRRCDLTDPVACLRVARGVDLLFACAAASGGGQAMRDEPTARVQANLRIVAGLLEAARAEGVARVVLVGSATVYQDVRRPVRETDLDWNAPPPAPYQGEGWCWRYLEQLARLYHDRHGLGVVLVRASTVYGPGDAFDPGRARVLPALVRRALAREEPFVVWGTGAEVRDFVFVDDLADDLIALAARGPVADPVNLGHGRPTTIREAVDAVLEATGHRAAPVFDRTRPSAVPYRALDTTKADALLGPRARTSLVDGVAATVRWARAAGAA